MKIFDIITEDKKTWMKDGVEMCSKDCCGQPVTECECGPECKHCDCYKVNERYSLAQGRTAMGKFNSDQTNMNKRINNKMADTNRELTIKQTQMNKNANRDARRLPTGTPNRAAYDNMRQDLLRGRGIQNQ